MTLICDRCDDKYESYDNYKFGDECDCGKGNLYPQYVIGLKSEISRLSMDVLSYRKALINVRSISDGLGEGGVRLHKIADDALEFKAS